MPSVATSWTTARSSNSVSYATYAWNADEVIARWRAGTLWRFAKSLQVKRFMLGFTDADIAKYSRKGGTAEMNAMIAGGNHHGITFVLLLGDPSWIVPSGIPVLEGILHKLRFVHFAAVNLDLEPSEVKGLPIETVVTDLVDAIRQYVAVSPWPVELDANWIYVNDGNKFNGGYCFPCGLQAAKLKRIALMVYISNPKTVYDVAAPILKRYSSFSFTISQSVEPPSVLPRQDSYWSDGYAKFYAAMQRLDAKMRVRPNYAGLNVQSLAYLETMPP
jgi:hypothetical protein